MRESDKAKSGRKSKNGDDAEDGDPGRSFGGQHKKKRKY